MAVGALGVLLLRGLLARLPARRLPPRPAFVRRPRTPPRPLTRPPTAYGAPPRRGDHARTVASARRSVRPTWHDSPAPIAAVDRVGELWVTWVVQCACRDGVAGGCGVASKTTDGIRRPSGGQPMELQPWREAGSRPRGRSTGATAPGAGVRVGDRDLDSAGVRRRGAHVSRTYVLDTSVLLSDPRAMLRFAEHDVVLPVVVITELEAKRHHAELGYFARSALRTAGRPADQARPARRGGAGGRRRRHAARRAQPHRPARCCRPASGWATTTRASSPWRRTSPTRATTSRWCPRTCRCGSRPPRSGWPPRSTAHELAVDSGWTGMSRAHRRPRTRWPTCTRPSGSTSPTWT